MLKGTQIKVIKQNIEVIGENNKKQSKEYIVGCRHKECNIHKNSQFSEKSCKYGSDLFNIQIKESMNIKAFMIVALELCREQL